MISSTEHPSEPELAVDNPTPSHESGPSFWVIAGVILLALYGVSFALVNLTPHDLWWQMRSGMIVAEEGRIPTTDRYSFTARGEPWLVQEWLSGLIFYRLQETFGLDSIVWLKFGLMAAALLGIAAAGWLRGAHVLLAMIGAVFALGAFRPWMAMRPQLFTYALFAVLLDLLAGARRHKNPAWFIPLFPLTALWANLHAGALLAPALLFIETAGSALDNLRLEWRRRSGSPHRKPERPDWIWTGWLAGITLLTALATLLTPHGIEIWKYPGQVTRHPIVTNFITEWRSPDFHSSGFIPFSVLCFLLVVVMICEGPRPPYRDYLLLALLLATAMVYKRNVPLFVLAACPVLVGRGWKLLLRPGGTSAIRWPWIGAAACVFATVQLVGTVRKWPTQHLFESQAGMFDFPVGAVKFLKNYPLPGPLFNEYRWGGYLIWHLPEVPVFIDGRAEVYYRKGVFDDYVRVHRLQPGWQQSLKKHRIRAVLAEPYMPFVQMLREDPNWSIVYEDARAVVMIREPYPLEESGEWKPPAETKEI